MKSIFTAGELARVGWNDHWAEWWEGQNRATDAVPARIRRVDRGEVEIVEPDGDSRARTSPADPERPRPDQAPITGDWAVVEPDVMSSPPSADPQTGARSSPPSGDPQTGARSSGLDAALTSIAPRRTELRRRDPSVALGAQVLAANIDIVFVVEPLDRPINQRRIERALVLAHDSRADPVVVLTKADAAIDDDPLPLVQAVAGGVSVFITSAESGAGLDELDRFLDPGSTVTLFGQSGVGKSTLVNHLAGGDLQEIGDVRARDRRGRHTTVTRDLIVLPTGAILVDTPGVRELGLWEAEDGLDRAFPEITELTTQCRFANCGHRDEPACAVRAGVEDGTVPERRLASWLDLAAELDALTDQQEQHARTLERRENYHSRRKARRR
ncbi:MAG: ribosome small subunit-dependent GTPase A [Actinomycetia bacterium]|nr:ribosome small subunit-dependent GTPase A [Actinomycetes bacterium]